MKKIIAPLLVIAALFLLPACSEKFNVAAPYKNITVIYGLLDKADTAHYIRIEKAFLDENKSALAMATVPDSSFYNNIKVRVDMINMSTGNVYTSINLQRVDLNTEGYTKDPGTFFTAPSYAYKFKNSLDPSYLYRIVVTNMATGDVDSADAPVIDDVNTTTFNIPFIDNGPLFGGLGFASTNKFAYSEVDGQYQPQNYFSFNGFSSPVSIVQSFLRFNWYDSNRVTGALTARSYDYPMGYQPVSNNAFTYKLYNTALYNAVAGGLGTPRDSFTVRLLDRCDLIVYAGTADFNTYVQISALQGVGLTGSDIQPTYTNIKGKNVLGLYTARGVRSGKITITNETIDSLMASPITANTKIVGTIYH